MENEDSKFPGIAVSRIIIDAAERISKFYDPINMQPEEYASWHADTLEALIRVNIKANTGEYDYLHE